VVAQASYRASQRVPATAARLSLLAPKLLDKQRRGHISDFDFDEALGLFAGLKVLPRKGHRVMPGFPCTAVQAGVLPCGRAGAKHKGSGRSGIGPGQVSLRLLAMRCRRGRSLAHGVCPPSKPGNDAPPRPGAAVSPGQPTQSPGSKHRPFARGLDGTFEFLALLFKADG